MQRGTNPDVHPDFIATRSEELVRSSRTNPVTVQTSRPQQQYKSPFIWILFISAMFFKFQCTGFAHIYIDLYLSISYFMPIL